MIGNNLMAHLEHLDRSMRDAAADLDFEKAARIRDEIKRLREMELAISDDPLARYAEAESPVSGREKGRHNKGRQRHRTVDDDARKPLFQKPSLDDMGPGTDVAKPAGPAAGRLFRKQSHREAHEADHGIPSDAGTSLFRKNALDEMTVRRTETPAEGDRPVKRYRAGIGSHEDAADQRRMKRRSGKTGRPGR